MYAQSQCDFFFVLRATQKLQNLVYFRDLKVYILRSTHLSFVARNINYFKLRFCTFVGYVIDNTHASFTDFF